MDSSRAYVGLSVKRRMSEALWSGLRSGAFNVIDDFNRAALRIEIDAVFVGVETRIVGGLGSVGQGLRRVAFRDASHPIG